MSAIYPRLEKWIGSVLGFLLFSMVALTFFDVLGRHLFNRPIYGAHDLTEHLMAIIIFCGLPLVTARREHLTIDLLKLRFITRYIPWWFRIIDIGIAIALTVISVQYAIAAREAVAILEVSQELLIPRSGMYVLISIASGLAALASLRSGLRKFDAVVEPQEVQP